MNKDKWINSFNNLDPDNQLKVAEAIANELKDNESFLDKEYDKTKSKSIRFYFENIISFLNRNKELESLLSIIKRFDTLTSNSKKKVIKDLANAIKKYLHIEEQANKERICKESGHVFDKWEKVTWTTYEDVMIDHELIHNYKCNNVDYRRTCTRCGFVERRNDEPQELIDERTKRNKQIRIKQLESELQRLKKEND